MEFIYWFRGVIIDLVLMGWDVDMDMIFQICAGEGDELGNGWVIGAWPGS